MEPAVMAGCSSHDNSWPPRDVFRLNWSTVANLICRSYFWSIMLMQPGAFLMDFAGAGEDGVGHCEPVAHVAVKLAADLAEASAGVADPVMASCF
ncbi:hypothetical protein Nepgr_001069 [Nepenthes gracilis]|uniref:Uncharacterized protein n=1 Tax=Nepenthes gracilis TaxID=150966 RepID=A0AAD3P5F1_NEPGR|nr:hypothetical protein Nepgr_001069 [Nepenthes gracilis]